MKDLPWSTKRQAPRPRGRWGLAVAVNLGLGGAASLLVLGVYVLNGNGVREQASRLDAALDATIKNWDSRGIPPSDRRLVIAVRDEYSGEVLRQAPPRGFFPSLLSWAAGGQEPPITEDLATSLSRATPVLPWREETLLRRGDREASAAALGGLVTKALDAKARLIVVGRGRACRLALEALRQAEGPAKAEVFAALGASRSSLGVGVLPARSESALFIWTEGAGAIGSIRLNYGDTSEEGWISVPANDALAALARRTLQGDSDILAGLRELLLGEGGVRAALIRSEAVKPKVAGLWKGAYYYPEKGYDPPRPPVNFEVVLRQSGNSFDGRISEPNTFGDKTSNVLKAWVVMGILDSTGRIRWVKRYDGTAAVSHSVVYEGKLAPDGLSITGQWTLLRKKGGQASGRFEMRRPGSTPRDEPAPAAPGDPLAALGFSPPPAEASPSTRTPAAVSVPSAPQPPSTPRANWEPKH